jgi:transposase, IS30 family
LTAEERATLMVMRADGCSQRAVARCLGRSASTISRELARNASCCKPDTTAVIPYDASLAGKRALVLRQEPRRNPKLAADTALFAVMLDYLREGWSPEQIAGRLKRAWPDDQSKTVSHETIYTALYAMPRGGLRKDLIACLRHGRAKRRPRSRGQDRRGQIPDMLSLHVRPPEVEDRLVPGHWEGDLIKGARNQSAVGTLVERTSRLVLLARMEGATAEAALAGFTCILNRVHMPMRKTLTYDQGKEMSRHKDLTAVTGVAVYFADPHSPWQRGSNENTNGLLRHYLPKGTDLSGLTQEELDAIAWKLNTRPRKLHGFRSPIEVYDEHIAKANTTRPVDTLPARFPSLS